MVSTVFVNGVTLTDEDWANDLNRLHYTILGDPATVAAARTALGLGTGDSPTITGLTASGLTASLPIFTNGSKALASNAMTGTGNVVMSASPTLTGTAGFASLTASGTAVISSNLTTNGTLTVNRVSSQGDQLITADYSGTSYGFYAYACSNGGYSGTATGVVVATNSGTGRSINAGGTINASGADYAEYERKASDCGEVAKGQIIGFDVNGEVTDLWERAKSFGVKTTNPAYVGGDTWGSEDALALKIPKKKDGDNEAKHKQDTERFEAKLEAARQTVDRIAYSGKVPVNVLGAKVGDYIIPVQDGDGIAGKSIESPTFDQYRIAVGQVRNILPDGRATISVKVG